VTGTETASLIIGALGLIGATVSLIWQWRTRHDQKRPDIGATYEFFEGVDWLHIANQGPIDLTRVRVQIEMVGAGAWPVILTGRNKAGTEAGPLQVGKGNTLSLDRLDNTASGQMQLRIDCWRKRAKWTVSRIVYIPPMSDKDLGPDDVHVG
jgi:hypothetical protein